MFANPIRQGSLLLEYLQAVSIIIFKIHESFIALATKSIKYPKGIIATSRTY